MFPYLNHMTQIPYKLEIPITGINNIKLRPFNDSLATEMGLIRRRTDTFFYLLFLCLLFGLMLTAFNVYELSSMKNAESGNGKIVDNQKYLAWIHADHVRDNVYIHL